LQYYRAGESEPRGSPSTYTERPSNITANGHGAALGGRVRADAGSQRWPGAAAAAGVFWADGIYVQARLEDEAQSLLVIIGATPEGKKELVGLADGLRESAHSWRDLLLDLKRRGLSSGPQLAVGDGALGFWKALDEVWPTTRAQRCWVHKTANVLNKLPNSFHAKAKHALHDIWMAETRKDAEAALDVFIERPTAASTSGRRLLRLCLFYCAI
jgi:transposase-like protein